MIINRSLGANNFFNKEIDNNTKILLLNRAMMDRRLNAKDLKLFLFLLNGATHGYTQEQIGDILDMARVNINRSSVKLETFGYIQKNQESPCKAIEYDIETDLNESGLYIPFILCANLEKTNKEERINEDDIKKLEKELSLIEDTVRERINGIVTIDKYILDSILSDDKLRMLLFILCSENPKLEYFQKKYLKNTFIMIINNHNFNYKEEFIQIYYACEDEVNNEYTYNDLMLLLGDEHRDVLVNIHKRKDDLINLHTSTYSIIEKMLDIATSLEILELEPLKRVLDSLNIDAKRLKESEILVLLHLKDAQKNFKEYIGIELEKYIKIKYLEIYESLLTYKNLLNKYKDLLKEDEE